MITTNPINTLISSIKSYRCQKICIEAGQIYIDRAISQEQVTGVKIGAFIRRTLLEDGFQAYPVTLVDDYHVSGNLDIRDYGSWLRGNDFPAEIVMESSLVSQGSKGSIGRTMSCAELDAVFYIWKLARADLAITVLPEDYQSQQQKTRKILYGKKVRGQIVIVYFNPDWSWTWERLLP